MNGPLHLQRHITECTDELGTVMRGAVHHSITLVRSLHCPCRPSKLMRVLKNTDSSRSRILLPLKEGERRQACRFFLIHINDEEGLLHAFCRRCNQLVIVFDRALYWGVKRQSKPPELFPYMCSCGSHTFELALGFNYPDTPIDENDIDTITVATRCATCSETSVILDDEA